MGTNITRREAGKVLALATAAVVVSPAVLAGSNSDAELLRIASRYWNIWEKEIPANEREHEAAEKRLAAMLPKKSPAEVFGISDLDMIEARAIRATSEAGKIPGAVAAIREHFGSLRAKASEYEAAHKEARRASGLDASLERDEALHSEASEISHAVLSMLAQTPEGMAAKIRIAIVYSDDYREAGETVSAHVRDCFDGLLRDLVAVTGVPNNA